MLQRLRSGDLTPQGPEGLAAAPDGVPAAAVAALLGEKQSEKDLGLDSEGEVSASEAEDDGEDVECGVCLDAAVSAAAWRGSKPCTRLPSMRSEGIAAWAMGALPRVAAAVHACCTSPMRACAPISPFFPPPTRPPATTGGRRLCLLPAQAVPGVRTQPDTTGQEAATLPLLPPPRGGLPARVGRRHAAAGRRRALSLAVACAPRREPARRRGRVSVAVLAYRPPWLRASAGFGCFEISALKTNV